MEKNIKLFTNVPESKWTIREFKRSLPTKTEIKKMSNIELEILEKFLKNTAWDINLILNEREFINSPMTKVH